MSQEVPRVISNRRWKTSVTAYFEKGTTSVVPLSSLFLSFRTGFQPVRDLLCRVWREKLRMTFPIRRPSVLREGLPVLCVRL